MSVAAGGLAAGLAAKALPVRLAARTFKAVAFDAFPIFDPRPVFALAEELFPGRGEALGAAWRTRQFEYTWLRTLSQHYADFEKTTSDALTFAARSLRLDLDAAKRQRLVGAYFRLKAWPDVLPSLVALKNAGIRLGFLSNFTRAMLEANLRNAGLTEFFEHVLRTDQVRAFKPDPRAYQMALEAFGLPREEIVFAAFAGWDVAGAKAFGHPTFWVNRQNAPAEELDFAPDAVGSIGDLLTFVRSE
jgi:2-haloacid dehalogenase